MSNFNVPELRTLLASARIKPVVNQVLAFQDTTWTTTHGCRRRSSSIHTFSRAKHPSSRSAITTGLCPKLIVF